MFDGGEKSEGQLLKLQRLFSSKVLGQTEPRDILAEYRKASDLGLLEFHGYGSPSEGQLKALKRTNGRAVAPPHLGRLETGAVQDQ